MNDSPAAVVQTSFRQFRRRCQLSKSRPVGMWDETLKGEGPFTVFAPTDEAFAKLPEEVVNKCRTPFSGRPNRPFFGDNDGLKRPSYE
ncbi:MAG: fasciclin domain-containing protein [Planctomycetaceae bacterium]